MNIDNYTAITFEPLCWLMLHIILNMSFSKDKIMPNEIRPLFRSLPSYFYKVEVFKNFLIANCPLEKKI